ncbi:RNA polymerase sigma factor [Gorillibacterium timonense]|uniref:RNA polymerase sigma factor n=1 Tax=Gorillibacterium timonense TaxID=1689269 RepID=UPI00071E4D1F|nr:sigma-70 family RNA polymerase sigma factor [Gorillibacterium timonense]
MDDAELLERIHGGDPDALNQLIERHYDSICRYCYWKTGNAAMAQDLTQETFYRFFRSLDRYTHTGKCRAYLYTIARRLASNARKDLSQVGLDQIAESALGTAPSAEETAERVWQSRELVRWLAHLPDELQEAVILRYSYGLRFREISAITGVNLYTAQYRVKRGLAALKKIIQKEETDDEEPEKPAARPSPASPCSRP